MLVASLGVDTATADGVLSLDGEDYVRLGGRVGSLAVPTVLIQEGGYALEFLGVHVGNVLEGLSA